MYSENMRPLEQRILTKQQVNACQIEFLHVIYDTIPYPGIQVRSEAEEPP